MKNTKNPESKTSNIMRIMNYLLYSIFVFQLILCLIFAGCYIDWEKTNVNSTEYMPLEINKLYNSKIEKIANQAYALNYFLQVFTFLVAYSHLIPISLYVALEIIKLIQTNLIGYDNKMYDFTKNKPALARTSDLIEELGQVEFIFTDKTGTLTKNEMVFKKCSINFNRYGVLTKPLPEDDIEYSKNFSECDDLLSIERVMEKRIFNQNMEEIEFINKFFLIITLCHSAFIENYSNDKIIYHVSILDR